MPDPRPIPHVAALRRFTRFYARRIGPLSRPQASGSLSPGEGRVLVELGSCGRPITAAELGRVLGLDAGYVSRVLGDFARRRLITRTVSEVDERTRLLNLTDKGRETFAILDARSDEEFDAILGAISPGAQRRLIDAMGTIERILEPRSDPATPYIIRPPQPGDMGWIVHRHGVLSAREYGWDERFEALVASFVAEFIRYQDPKRERCWIAEREGAAVGSAFLVQQSKRVAKLRLLLVEPDARGLGIGSRLVDECVRFARRVRYRKLTLWTNDAPRHARHIYQRAGFRLTREAKHHRFGGELVGQTWELNLPEVT